MHSAYDRDVALFCVCTCDCAVFSAKYQTRSMTEATKAAQE